MADRLWDIAGIDSLEVAQRLFGEAVGYLAPFQSLETVVAGQDCSVLRLCDRNFRIAYPGPLNQHIAPLQASVWIKQYSWLSAVFLPESQLSHLANQATVRPPHRLANLPNHQAVPAQLDDIAILIWRHPTQGSPTVELHTARTAANDLLKKIRR